MTPTDLADEYDALAYRASNLDPVREWFDLVDQMRRDQRERSRAAALRALDLYYGARVIGDWHHRITGARLEDVADWGYLGAPEARERLYGNRRLRGNREALPPLLEHFGLYPWRLQLIVEGESEEVMLRILMKRRFGWTLEQRGIALLDLKGAGIPRNTDLLLGAMRQYANYYFLLFDNEGNARDLRDALVRARHIEGIPDRHRKRAIDEALAHARDLRDRPAEERLAALKAAREAGQALDHEPGAAPEFFFWREDLEADNLGPSSRLVPGTGPPPA